MECHFVNEVAAIGIEDDLSDEKLYIYILTKLKKIKEKDISYLLNFVKKKMYKTERPDKIIFLKTIPKTLSGKIIKRKLKYINAQDKIREIIL
jgi:acyl-coenzyme A synthetase/AMP-(fatty) acid ligase